MHTSAEPIRRPPKAKADRRTGANSTGELIQILSGSCGKGWRGVLQNIIARRARMSQNARQIFDERLDALVCRSNRTLETTHIFRVKDRRLERIQVESAAAAS